MQDFFHGEGKGVTEGVDVIIAGTGVFVEVGTGDAVGTGEDVAKNVEVTVGHGVIVNVGGTDVNEAVDVGKTSVTLGMGVLVGTLGTHNRCPA